jgi:ABC-2 type transport system permease protein
MKIIDIALKDMSRSFRSLFALMFMFGVPLLMAGMFYFMFGGRADNQSSYTLPVTKVVVANLDKGSPEFTAANIPQGDGVPPASMGEMIVSSFQEKNFADLMSVTTVDSAEAARSAVDKQQAGVAIIIPADFTEKFSNSSGQATIELYKDPTLTLGPGIVESILSQYMDSMSGVSIAVDVAVKQTGRSDSQLIGQTIQKYMAASPSGDQTAALLDVRSPSTTKTPVNTMMVVISMILGGMTVFYAFFTGASQAQSILREEEEGTLQRLFTTPTTQSTILGGKFLAVGLTVVVQMTVLFVLGRLIFGINWGPILPLAVLTLGTVLAASSFGIFLMSLLKNAKQSAVVFGGVITTTGMLGMIKVFTMGSANATWADTVSLFVPQGWAARGLIQLMDGASLTQILPTCGVLAAMSIVFFVIGVLRFQKRFA